MITNNEIEAIKRAAKLEAVEEIERRIKKYYAALRGHTHPGMVTYYIETKIKEYKKEIENGGESEAHGSYGG